MGNRREPLRVGETAPDFRLTTANDSPGRRAGAEFSLHEVTKRGPVIVEFLRGTW